MKTLSRSIHTTSREKYAPIVFAVLFSMFFGSFTANSILSAGPKVKGAHTASSERSKKMHILSVPNDTYYPTQWGLPKTKAPQGWDISTGSGTVVIAVLDTGVLTTHEDMSGKLWTNPGEIAGNGIDDDGNGKVDDINGWDFVGAGVGDNNINPDPGGGDGFSHGTEVASIAAASTGNGVGIAGVCQGCKVMPVRVMDNDGWGDDSDVADGIRYAVDNGADVINMSFGSAYADGTSPAMTSAVQYAYDNGVVMVAAAGNDGTAVNYPAAYPQVIAVGATNSSDVQASWSSYGSALDVMAPGVSVTAATSIWSGGAYTTDDYSYASGTSMSAPHIAGLVGLVLSAQPTYFDSLRATSPSLVNDNILSRMTTQVDKVAGMGSSNYTAYYGYGRVNNYNSLARWLSLSYPKSGISTVKRTFQISGAAKSSTNVDISLDGGAPATVTSGTDGVWTHTLSNLSYGNHSLEITSLDMSGNPQTIAGSYKVLSKTPVYQLWSAKYGDHFYTTNKAYMRKLNSTSIWRYQGIAFYTYSSASVETAPVYQLWSAKYGDHFYTKSKAYMQKLNATSIWKYQGVAFYTYGSKTSGTKPVYQLWSTKYGDHFYTTNKAYMRKLNSTSVWRYQGIAFYANGGV